MAAPQLLGTEDLEADMQPTRARDVVTIALIAVAILLVFNSKSLVDWTRRPQAWGPIAALEPPAAAWDALMERLGPAAAYQSLRRSVQRVLSG